MITGVSKVEQMEVELRKLSQAELRQIREWLDDIIEDELEFTSEFEASIRHAERDMAQGKSARVREPEGS
jgi:ribosome biogenesis protein Nip4